MSSHWKEKIKNKNILITGGTGSFGNTVVTKLLEGISKKIVIFSRDEKKQFDMRNKYDNPLLKFIVGDVRDESSLDKAMVGIDYVFHAAALKQVPSCEFFPLEAIKTNILGATNVIQLALRHSVERVVVLSTDKAVYPINAMGMTKALMEKIMVSQAKNVAELGKNNTVLCGVRYGNVLYTRGSVIPYFVSLIKQKKKLPVTNFEMTRFLLPLPDAVGLVLHALVHGENGYMYVRKSPACTLETMVKALCKIFDYKQEYYEVGIRAGEKMHETLVTEEELLRAVDIGDYYKIPSESQGLDYNKYFFRGKKNFSENTTPYTSENTKRLNLKETIQLIKKLPEIKKELEDAKKKEGREEL